LWNKKIGGLKISYQKYQKIKCQSLRGRYITSDHIAPELERLSIRFGKQKIGWSVNKKPIYALKFGNGDIKVLMWSQMHGNESTTTKAVFDLINFIDGNEFYLNNFQICVVPILNPDGAEAYTRVNANMIDLNRDAKLKSQPETLALFKIFEDFRPHYCFNLHGQRTIFAAGINGEAATLSFLSPAQDEERSITPNRLKAMSLIGRIFKDLSLDLENAIGLYDDTFNENCTGDAFQGLGIPTILFEAGHYPKDYEREQTRYYVFKALISALDNLVSKEDTSQQYHKIPRNEKVFLDVIIRNVRLNTVGLLDIGIQFEERLTNSNVVFTPVIQKIENLRDFRGHQEIDTKGQEISFPYNRAPKVGDEIDFVILKNEKILIKT
jgi:hypothetical protein